jgi:hypothetical protein
MNEEYNLCKCGAVIFNDAETCLACAIDNMKGESDDRKTRDMVS